MGDGVTTAAGLGAGTNCATTKSTINAKMHNLKIHLIAVKTGNPKIATKIRKTIAAAYNVCGNCFLPPSHGGSVAVSFKRSDYHRC